MMKFGFMVEMTVMLFILLEMDKLLKMIVENGSILGVGIMLI
jgi:hypothetical protein